MGLLDRRARDDEQPNGAAERDRGIPRDRPKRRLLPRAVHERLAVSREGDDGVGIRLGEPRLATARRRDREPRTVAGARVGGGAPPSAVAMGPRPRRPSAERVRERSGGTGGQGAELLAGRTHLRVRSVARGTAGASAGDGRAGAVPYRAALRTDAPAAAGRHLITLGATMDDVDRMYRHLVRTVRATSSQLLNQPFQVADLYATILPYRLHRRDLGLETNQDYEMAMLELLSGGRGYLIVENRMREVLGESLKSPNPDPQLIREFASSRVALAPEALKQLDPDAVAASSSAAAPTLPTGVPATEAASTNPRRAAAG